MPIPCLECQQIWSVAGFAFRPIRRLGTIGIATSAAFLVARYNPASTTPRSTIVVTAMEKDPSIQPLVAQTHWQDPRPEVLVAACTILGISLVDLHSQSKPHRYQDLLCLAHFVAAATLCILDCFQGSPLPSALRKILPMMMLCGQIVNMVVGLAVAPKKDEEQDECIIEDLSGFKQAIKI